MSRMGSHVEMAREVRTQGHVSIVRMAPACSERGCRIVYAMRGNRGRADNIETLSTDGLITLEYGTSIGLEAI